MTSRLHAAFQELADDAPSAAPDLAGRSWVAGRARRRRRRAGFTVLAATVLAAVALLVPQALRPDGRPAALSSTGGDGVDHYPQRVGYWFAPSMLPDKPGPLAGTFFNNFFGDGYWVGVGPGGKIWDLGPDTNVLSPDGRLLLRAQPQLGDRPQRLLVQDLTTGTRRVFGDIEVPVGRAPRLTYKLEPNAPVYWSSDSSRIVLSAGETPHRFAYRPRVLDVATGVLTTLRRGVPAGFRSADEPVTVHTVGSRTARVGIVATTMNLRTGQSRDLPLRLNEPWRGEPDDFTASVSPDGSTLLLIEGPEGTPQQPNLRLFSMRDGDELTPRAASGWDGCPPSWTGDDPVIPTKTPGKSAESVRITPDGPRSLVALHPRLQSRCVQWATDALDGGPTWSLLGQRTAWWTWYWYLVLPLMLIPVVGVMRVRQRRRRGRQNPGPNYPPVDTPERE